MKRICRRNSNTASGEFVMLAKKGMNLFSEGLKMFKATWTDLNENLKTSAKKRKLRATFSISHHTCSVFSYMADDRGAASNFFKEF